MIKLCYKEYGFKFTMGACKYFYEQTGRDLQHSLIRYIETTALTRESASISRLSALHGVLPFKDASILFHAVIKAENKNVPLEEIQDAMYRVSWMPTEDESGLIEPWPLIMLKLATDASEYFSELAKKKADTSD